MLRDAGEWSGLDDALSALGAKDREALVLHYFEDRSYAEKRRHGRVYHAACGR